MHQPLHLRANKENGKSSDDKGNAPRAQPNRQKAFAKANIEEYQSEGNHECGNRAHQQGKYNSLFQFFGLFYWAINTGTFTLCLNELTVSPKIISIKL